MKQTSMECAPEYDVKLSQYFTAPALAEHMAGLLPDRCCSVLEPSAGSGNLVRAALDETGAKVTALDIDIRWLHHLAERFDAETGEPEIMVPGRVDILSADFMTFSPGDFFTFGYLQIKELSGPFDAALMNPPLDGGAGVDHVAHALTMAPVVVTLLRNTDLHTVGRHERFWSEWGRRIDHVTFVVRKSIFKGAKTDFVVVRFNRAHEGPAKLEWW